RARQCRREADAEPRPPGPARRARDLLPEMLHPAKARVIAAQVRRELASLGRDAGSFDARRYFRATADVGFYNTGTARMRGTSAAPRPRGSRSESGGMAPARSRKADAVRLARYLRSEGPRIPRTTVRYAIERFDERTRRALVVATDRRSGTHGR